ncbi:restriction endonuclease [Morganella morganii]|nr:restriction endonuclease [Morganella morganii]
MTEWRRYERIIAALCSSEFCSDEITVTPNASIVGCISKAPRQLDILIDRRIDNGVNKRIIVDAKRYNRPINVKDIESFEGMMRDCSATQGILVCPHGYSKAAKNRADQHIQIRLLTLEQLKSLDLDSWEPCFSKKCYDKKSSGYILWDSPFVFNNESGPLTVYCIGKCDECGDFHIWCWGCGGKFAMTNEDEHQCNCYDNSLWVTAKEADIDGKIESIHLFYIKEREVLVVDRKPKK